MPPHSSHLLQQLNVGCFLVLKHVYGDLVAKNMYLSINYIDKAEMLSIHYHARTQALSPSNIQSGFRATGLIPANPGVVLDTLEIRAQTPDCHGNEIASQSPPQADKTPRNLAELDAHFSAI